MSSISELNEVSLQELYTWIDEIPLSRPKKNFARDFSDGVLVAEIIKHFIPSIVDLHNYVTANSTSLKTDNWNLLTRKVFNRLTFNVEEDHIKGIVMCRPGYIEHVLTNLRENIDSYMMRKKTAEVAEKNLIENSSNTYQTIYNYPTAYSDNQKYVPLPNPVYHFQNSESDSEKLKYDTIKAKPKIQEDQPVISIHNSEQPTPADPSQQSDNKISSSNKTTKKSKNDSKEAEKLKETKKKSDIVNDAQISSPGSNKSLKMTGTATMNPSTQANKIKQKLNSKNDSSMKNNSGDFRVALEEKEQALLAAQETIQILHAKIRRLEHLLQLKDLRINELKESTQQQQQPMVFNQVQAEHQHTPLVNQNYVPPPLQSYPYQQNGNFSGQITSLPLINNKQNLKDNRGLLDKDSRYTR